jgi:hypothetical protein
MYARHASRFSMRACSGSLLAPEAGWFAVADADRVSTCITSGADLAHDQSPQRLATNKLTAALPDTFNFDPSLAHLSVTVVCCQSQRGGRPRSGYSYLNAAIGSILVALYAGSAAAIKATTNIKADVIASKTGSVGLTP